MMQAKDVSPNYSTVLYLSIHFYFTHRNVKSPKGYKAHYFSIRSRGQKKHVHFTVNSQDTASYGNRIQYLSSW